jgi:hypothetical protein
VQPDASQLRQFFDDMQIEAFRLETLPIYRFPQEEVAIQRFRAGGLLATQETASWAARLSQLAETGRHVRRVHVLTRPLTEYLEFEFEEYRRNVAAGEDTRILDITLRGNPGLPNQDFWMFDDEHVVLMNYATDGAEIGLQVYEGELDLYRRWKRIALEESVPFLEYLEYTG